MEEKVFLGSAESSLFVSSSRISLGGKMYSTANVTTVGTYLIKPRRKAEILLVLFGVVLALFHTIATIVIGLILIALGVIKWIYNKPKYSIRLGSASGEAEAIQVPDKEYTNKIVQAINEAIVYRG